MSDNEKVDINGTLIWYYYICKREVWLIVHQIQPDQEDSNVELGRFIHEHSYNRSKKEISTGNIKLDIIKNENGQLIIGEVKKSSKYEKSARMQLAYYLYELTKLGIYATGELLFPKEKKKLIVTLDKLIITEIKRAIKEILLIIYNENPPEAIRIPVCRNCAYSEFCWA